MSFMTPGLPVSPTGNQLGVGPGSVGGGTPALQISNTKPGVGKISPANPPGGKPVGPIPWGRGGNTVKASLESLKQRAGSTEALSRSSGPSITPADVTMLPDSKIGFPTNYSIPFAQLIRACSHPLMTQTMKYQLVIEKKETRDNPDQQRLGQHADSRRYTTFGVVQWNYMQAATEKRIDMAKGEASLDARAVWEEWAVKGVVRTEEGQEEDNHRDEVGKERLLNIVVRGFCFVYNGWSETIQPGTKLFLVLKKEFRRDSTFYDFAGNTGGFSGITNSNVTDKPFQLSFWADPLYDYPPDDALRYQDEYGYWKRGIAIYIGALDEWGAGKTMQRMMDEDVTRSLSALVSRQQIFIFLDAMDPE